MKTKTLTLFLVITGLLLSACKTKYEYPFMDPSKSIDERVDDLVSRMTLEEKISQMNAFAPAIDRLKVPAYQSRNECLHGVAFKGVATVFPQAIGLAATWDTDLMHQISDVISTEARAKYHEYKRSMGKRGKLDGLTFWSPNLNIFRDPRWGRGQETYGEDPVLTSKMGVAFVKGLQGNDPKYLKVIATPKHFAVHSGPEPARHHFNAVTDLHDLWDTYLPAFEAAITKGKAFSVMGAYNRYRGQACCAHDLLLGKILRDKWKFNGYVVSDCGAINDIYGHHKLVNTLEEAAALAVKKGCDMSCEGAYNSLDRALKLGLISEHDIDVSLKRILRGRFKLGLFDPTTMVPYAQIPYEMNDAPEHNKLARIAARETIVLLKNDHHLLPLDTTIKQIAVIGPTADYLDVLLGNYNGTTSRPVTALNGIINGAGKGTSVKYAPGCVLVGNDIVMQKISDKYLSADGKIGLKGEYYTNRNLLGKPSLVRIDRGISFDFHEDALENFPNKNFSIRWTGQIAAPRTGKYTFDVTSWDNYHLYINEKELKMTSHWSVHWAPTKRGEIFLEQGKKYNIRLEYFQTAWKAEILMEWNMPGYNPYSEAINLAKSSDVVIFCGGISPRLEGEEMFRWKSPFKGFSGGDRTNLKLPEVQERLIKKIYATGTPIVYVNFSGSAIALNWENENLPTIIQAWYPGQAGGTALADVIFGRYNPSGRLPVTFYKSVKDLPSFEDYNMKNRTYRYFEGEPLYPFGYGLSYTTFAYGTPKLSANSISRSGSVTVDVEVQNTGDIGGDEVVQLYVRDVQSNFKVAKKALRDFQRIHLGPTGKQWVQFTLDSTDFMVIDNNGNRFVEPGEFDILVGGNSVDLTGTTLMVEQ